MRIDRGSGGAATATPPCDRRSSQSPNHLIEPRCGVNSNELGAASGDVFRRSCTATLTLSPDSPPALLPSSPLPRPARERRPPHLDRPVEGVALDGQAAGFADGLDHCRFGLQLWRCCAGHVEMCSSTIVPCKSSSPKLNALQAHADPVSGEDGVLTTVPGRAGAVAKYFLPTMKPEQKERGAAKSAALRPATDPAGPGAGRRRSE